MRESSGPRINAILLGVGFLALYAATRVEVHRFDALSYMLAAQSPATRFDPHHLLYTRLAWMFQSDGDPDRLIVAMQGLSNVAAAVGLGLFCRLLQHLSRRASVGWALVGTALLGISSSFWISAGESDPYALTLAGLIAATVCYRRAIADDALGWHVLAGLAVAAATLVHQLVVLYTLAYVLGLTLGRVRRPLACALVFLLPAAGIPTVVYLAVAVGSESVRTLGELFYWLTRYAQMGYWGGFRRTSLVDGLYGFLYSVAAGGAGLVSSLVVRTVAVASVIAGGYVMARRLGVVSAAPDRALRTLLVAWIALYVPFIVWWLPEYAVHWQFVLVPLIALVTWTAELAAPRSRIALATAAAVVLLIAGTNYVRAVWPLTVPDNDTARVFARYVLATLPSEARVVATIGGGTNLIAARLGPESVFTVPYAPAAHVTTAEILAALRAFVEAGWAQGRPVWVFANLLEPPSGRLSDPAFKTEVRRLLERLGTEGRLSVLPTDLLGRPLERHPWDVVGS